MANTNRNLCVDGHEYPDDESSWAGDGQFPPFAIFDIDAQENLLPFYSTREQAEEAMNKLLQATVADNGDCACGDCGTDISSIIGCPDGAEVCQSCFSSGAH